MSAKHQLTLTQEGEDTLIRNHGGALWTTGAMQTEEATKIGQLTITVEISAIKPNWEEFFALRDSVCSEQEDDGERDEFMRLRALDRYPKPRHLISEVDGYTQ